MGRVNNGWLYNCGYLMGRYNACDCGLSILHVSSFVRRDGHSEIAPRSPKQYHRVQPVLVLTWPD